MLITINSNNEIVSLNDILSKEDSKMYLSENTFWTDSSIPEINCEDGYHIVMHYDKENDIITLDYEKNKEPEPEEVYVSNNEIKEMISSVEETQLTQLMALADIYETIVME